MYRRQLSGSDRTRTLSYFRTGRSGSEPRVFGQNWQKLAFMRFALGNSSHGGLLKRYARRAKLCSSRPRREPCELRLPIYDKFHYYPKG